MTAAPDQLARGSAAGLRWTLASRVTGFVRIVAVGAVLGPTYLGNTFQAVNLLPNLVFYLAAGSLIPALLVPVLAAALADGDEARVRRLSRGATGVAVAAFGAVALMAAVAAPLLVRLLSSTVDDPTVAADQRRVGTVLLLSVVVQIPLYAVAGVGVAVQHAHRRFGLAAGAPVVENLGLLATLAVFAVVVGGQSLDSAGVGGAVLLGVGSTVAVAAHAVLQWWGASRLGVRLVPAAGWRDPDLRGLGRLALPSLATTAGSAARDLALLVATNSVAGGVVAFQVAYSVYNLVTALGAKPVSAAALPDLAEADRADQPLAFRSALDRAVAMVAVVAVPAAVGAVVLAIPLGAVLAVGEMGRDGGSRLVAAVLAGLGIAIVFDGLFILAQQAAFAQRRPRLAAEAMTARVVVTVVGLLGGAALTATPRAALLAIGLAVTAGDVLGTAVLWRGVTRSLPGRVTTLTTATRVGVQSWLAGFRR